MDVRVSKKILSTDMSAGMVVYDLDIIAENCTYMDAPSPPEKDCSPPFDGCYHVNAVFQCIPSKDINDDYCVRVETIAWEEDWQNDETKHKFLHHDLKRNVNRIVHEECKSRCKVLYYRYLYYQKSVEKSKN